MHNIGVCQKCGTPMGHETAYSLECSYCNNIVHLQKISGDYSERYNCDQRCLYAFRPNCSCSCAGVNHGLGFVANTQEAEENKAKAREAFQKSKDNSKIGKLRKAVAVFFENNPELSDIGNYPDNDFLTSLYTQLLKNGNLTEKQINAANRTIAYMKKQEEFRIKLEQQAEERKKNKVRLVSGKYAVTGTIIKAEGRTSYYGRTEQFYYAITVRQNDDTAVWGRAPKSIVEDVHKEVEQLVKKYIAEHPDLSPEKLSEIRYYDVATPKLLLGCMVSFTAEITPKDESFGFFKRPIGAKLIDGLAYDIVSGLDALASVTDPQPSNNNDWLFQ